MNYGILIGVFLGVFISAQMPVNARAVTIIMVSIVMGGVWSGFRVDKDVSLKNLFLRMLGLVCIAFLFYNYFPEYSYSLYSVSYSLFLDYYLVIILVYIISVKFGRDKSSWPIYLKSVAVRVYFLPLMSAFLVQHIQGIPVVFLFDTPYRFVSSVVWWAFLVDLTVGTIGYFLPGAMFGASVCGVDASLPGLFYCLVCYPPFWWLVNTRYINHDDGYDWYQWLAGFPFLAWCWAFLICVALFFYVGAVLSLGFKFSNLIYKGLCNNGLYSICRHPQYLGKIMFYWLTSVPFVNHLGFIGALSGIVSMMLVSFIYYMRAKTEENYLGQFEEYLQYSAKVPFFPSVRLLSGVVCFWARRRVASGRSDAPTAL